MEPEAEPPGLAATDDPAEPDPAGIGPGGGTPYTVYFPSEDGYLAADLGHAAPLPHVGDFVEYIDEGRVTHRYRVREVVHTLQLAPAYRPKPRAAGAGTLHLRRGRLLHPGRVEHPRASRNPFGRAARAVRSAVCEPVCRPNGTAAASRRTPKGLAKKQTRRMAIS